MSSKPEFGTRVPAHKMGEQRAAGKESRLVADSQPDMKVIEPAESLNANLSASYKAAYGQKADPDMGAKVPAGKNRDYNDSLTAKHVVEHPRAAEEVKGAAKKAIDAQCGHPRKHTDNMPLAQSGLGEDAVDPICK